MFVKLVKFGSVLLFLLPIVVYIGSYINAILISLRYSINYDQTPLYISQISFYIFIIIIIVIYFQSALKTWWLFLLTAITDFVLFFLSLTLFQRIYFSGTFAYPLSDILNKATSTYIISLIWILLINFIAFTIFIIINSKKIKVIPSIIYIIIGLIFIITNFFVIAFISGVEAQGDCGSYYLIAPVGKIERGSCIGG